MTTPLDDPRIEAAAARTKEAAQERAAAYGPPPWQPVWKRPRTPKTDQEKKKQLREQRARFQAAGQRRFAAGQSRRPRPRRNRMSRLRSSRQWRG